MRIVTGIMPLDKKRSRIWLDEEFAFVLYKGELRHYRIEEGGEINEAAYNEIMLEVLPKRAKLRAMNLLKSHTYSVSELKRKLSEGEYPEGIIQEALDYVASYGYTDDLRLCEEYIRIHLNDKSRMRIKQDLVRKGISTDIISSAFDNCASDGFESDELEQAVRLLKKRGYDPQDNDADEKEKYKQYAFLVRRGFSADVIRKAMGNLQI